MRILLALTLLLSACGQAPATKAPESANPAAAQTPNASASADQLRNADFAAYPVTPYTGARRLPDFNAAQRPIRDYRTALGAGAAQGPNFAGRYALVQIGCGASCNATYQIDLSTGDIIEIHFADETAVEIQGRV